MIDNGFDDENISGYPAYENQNIPLSGFHHCKSNSMHQQHLQENSEGLMDEEKIEDQENFDIEKIPNGQSNELIIRPIEGRQTNFYYIKESGGKIGRHSVNEVVIYDESVSRHHAEITFIEGEFYLQDIGSTTGTYIKIEERLPLEPDMILEIGSYQFRVKSILFNKKNLAQGSNMMVDFK